MDPQIRTSLQGFGALGLDALNSKAAMLERLDNKYIIAVDELQPALQAFSDHFDVLEIDDERAFTYVTTYFDDDRRTAYHDHHIGRRKRSKVRIRNYMDAGFSYLEVKLKDKRAVTIKKRLKVAFQQTEIDARCLDFIDQCHCDLYDAPFCQDLKSVIRMEYKRITLVAREGGERMTIDTRLQFQAANRCQEVAPDFFIVETKSARGNGIADKILRGLHMHPQAGCSKYCLGMAAMGQVQRKNKFLAALRRLDLAQRPEYQMPDALTEHGAVPSAFVIAHG